MKMLLTWFASLARKAAGEIEVRDRYPLGFFSPEIASFEEFLDEYTQEVQGVVSLVTHVSH